MVFSKRQESGQEALANSRQEEIDSNMAEPLSETRPGRYTCARPASAAKRRFEMKNETKFAIAGIILLVSIIAAERISYDFFGISFAAIYMALSAIDVRG